ncbi:MAG: phosphoribosylformylglycinamidine cyclo-ligase, partial [Syntrophomonas sp.]|nr:phosphoribosylformylglycinamidine cyclo-ligase [Syntrophomonas sp.]
LAVGRLEPVMIEDLVKGVSEGCLQAGCALIGGETAEMPGFYGVDDFDMAGFAVGVVERSRLINGSTIKHGDALVGLKSSGIHSNGYSLARKVLLEEAGLKLDHQVEELGMSLGEALLTPTRIYVTSVLTLLEEVEIRGMAHITGGGLVENLQRIMPTGLRPEIDTTALEPHPIFDMIARLGNVASQEMLRTFNMGTGFVLVVEPGRVKEIMLRLRMVGEEPKVIGQVGFDDRWLR